ncbi:glycoside hydrolase family 13 protein [Pseudobutyrivibrio ruminis]|uniref:Oligo-1,6-glucosidase n=1 Tax=Pseudobutyrivibrio ruminis DSM 9787 TaxID=1123011 RepID=A0A285SQZ3_9FIRM|nr:alpha-glucosidase [Pseudobutyrivibrio ruminis]SOC10665.1 oligo-1,6-glucosidase [Pseudobutyrivibrio ruminis DSM 9787]
MEKAWWKESVIYQIYPRSFCDSNGDGIGDLNGIRSKLDYLQKLGINVIWLSPIYKSPNDDNGYDISDYQDIMDDFGNMEDFDALLKEAHEHGIKIVMDLVVNHTSDEHKWFIESRSSKDNPKRDYYIWREPKDGKEPNNWGSCFSGSAWEFDEKTGMYYLHCFSKKQPDLNWDNEKVRDEVFNMMTWWCEKGIDGFRMDVISMISKVPGLPDGKKEGDALYGDLSNTTNGPRVHEYLQEMRKRVLSKYDLITVGECAGVTIEEAKKYANLDNSELNMVFQFEHTGLDYDERGKWTTKRFYLPDLKANLSKWQNELEGQAWNSLYWDNHDQPRIVSRLGDDSPLSAKCIATVLHMMKGTPYIYQGEELGMTNYPFKSIDECRDIEIINAYKELVGGNRMTEEDLLAGIRAKGRDNARTPMQWDETKEAGFTTGKPWIGVNPNYKTINAKSELEDSNSVFYYYQKLIELRRKSEWSDIIVYGTYQLLDKEDENIFAYTRQFGDRKILVVCNVSANEVQYKLDFDVEGKACLIRNYDNVDLNMDMSVPAWFAGVWEI